MTDDRRSSQPPLPRIGRAETDDEIRRCHGVLAQLRPHVPAEGFVPRVRRMERQGFRLAYVEDGGAVRAVAGYRLLDQLVSGLVLYVDDLVTDPTARSRGYGALLLRWLEDEARCAGCTHLELDSGVQRTGAHRFYFREGLAILAYHFRSRPLLGPADEERS